MLILKGNETVVKELIVILQKAGFKLFGKSDMQPQIVYGMVPIDSDVIAQIIVAMIGSGGLVATIVKGLKKNAHIKIEQKNKIIEIDVNNLSVNEMKEIIKEIKNI